MTRYRMTEPFGQVRSRSRSRQLVVMVVVTVIGYMTGSCGHGHASTVAVYCSICIRWVIHLVHRKRKCLMVSFACPQAHRSNSVARVCSPPSPSGSAFFFCCFALAMFIVVDLARYGCSRGEQPWLVACRAAAFALWPSSNSPRAGDP
jgi:hypothetical protein